MCIILYIYKRQSWDEYLIVGMCVNDIKNSWKINRRRII